MYVLSFAMVSSGISIAVEDRLEITWAAMAEETTGHSWISRQVGLTLMVGVNVPSTMSIENATIWLSVIEEFVNYTGSRYISQSTQTSCGGPATATMRDGRSLRDSDVRVLRQYFASGVLYVFKRSNILG